MHNKVREDEVYMVEDKNDADDYPSLNRNYSMSKAKSVMEVLSNSCDRDSSVPLLILPDDLSHNLSVENKVELVSKLAEVFEMFSEHRPRLINMTEFEIGSSDCYTIHQGQDKRCRHNGKHKRSRSRCIKGRKFSHHKDRSRSRRRHDRSRSRGRRDRSRSRGRRDRSRSRGRHDRSRSRGRHDRSRSRGRHDRSRSRGRHDRSRSRGRSDRPYNNRQQNVSKLNPFNSNGSIHQNQQVHQVPGADEMMNASLTHSNKIKTDQNPCCGIQRSKCRLPCQHSHGDTWQCISLSKRKLKSHQQLLHKHQKRRHSSSSTSSNSSSSSSNDNELEEPFTTIFVVNERNTTSTAETSSDVIINDEIDSTAKCGNSDSRVQDNGGKQDGTMSLASNGNEEIQILERDQDNNTSQLEDDIVMEG